MPDSASCLRGMLSAATALAFVWGSLCALVSSHFLFRAFTETENPLHNELAIGVAIGWLYGWPAWLILPVMAVSVWRKGRRWLSAVLIVPVALVAGTFVLLEVSRSAL